MNIGPGITVSGYRIERILGTGGMGTVYLARHPELPRWDALKVLSSQYSADSEYRARFEREANLAAALDHPNIVSIYNRGEDHGQLWIAMQYIDGIDAAAAAGTQAMTAWRALHIVTEVGRGLDHAHRRGMLHRDVKPANFLLTAGDNGEERVFLTDFGVAKSTNDTNELTQTGQFVATIAYASPEQLSGGALDHRADIYSLACSFFRLLTGRNPYPGAQPATVMIGHLNDPPPRASSLVPSLPIAVDEVLAVAMSKDPTERFDTCHEFTAALRSALEYGISGLDMHTVPQGTAQRLGTAKPTIPIPTKPAVAKRFWMTTAAATIIMALTIGGIVWITRDDASASTSATSTSTAPKSVAEARAQNPAFSGKRIVIVDISGKSGLSADIDVHLKPGSQAKFLEDLGFVYNPDFLRNGDEENPRIIPSGEMARYNALATITSGYLLAVRSDSDAGRGGLVNLPQSIASTSATVIVLDDPAIVAAIRQWSDESPKILLDKLLPILQKSVK